MSASIHEAFPTSSRADTNPGETHGVESRVMSGMSQALQSLKIGSARSFWNVNGTVQSLYEIEDRPGGVAASSLDAEDHEYVEAVIRALARSDMSPRSRMSATAARLSSACMFSKHEPFRTAALSGVPHMSIRSLVLIYDSISMATVSRLTPDVAAASFQMAVESTCEAYRANALAVNMKYIMNLLPHSASHYTWYRDYCNSSNRGHAEQFELLVRAHTEAMKLTKAEIIRTHTEYQQAWKLWISNPMSMIRTQVGHVLNLFAYEYDIDELISTVEAMDMLREVIYSPFGSVLQHTKLYRESSQVRKWWDRR